MWNTRNTRLAVVTAALATAITLGASGCGDDGSDVRDDGGNGSGSASTGSGSASN